MDNQVTALKVKVVSLMDEARRIRVEECRALGGVPMDGKGPAAKRDDKLYVSLRKHRVIDIRPEARCALLAYAFLRGVGYKRVEAKTRKPVDVKRVRQLVAKFGGLPDQPLLVEDGAIREWLLATSVPQKQEV